MIFLRLTHLESFSILYLLKSETRERFFTTSLYVSGRGWPSEVRINLAISMDELMIFSIHLSTFLLFPLSTLYSFQERVWNISKSFNSFSRKVRCLISLNRISFSKATSFSIIVDDEIHEIFGLLCHDIHKIKIKPPVIDREWDAPDCTCRNSGRNPI